MVPTLSRLPALEASDFQNKLQFLAESDGDLAFFKKDLWFGAKKAGWARYARWIMLPFAKRGSYSFLEC
jgi:hypothetical protein